MYNDLENKIIDWGTEKGILEKGTPMAQGLKTLEEVNEMLVAIQTKNRLELIDSLGDILVTIILQAEMNNLSLMNCLESAYVDISKRKGSMQNGTFVKN